MKYWNRIFLVDLYPFYECTKSDLGSIKKKRLLRWSPELISQRDNTLFNACRPARSEHTVFPSSWRLFDQSWQSQRVDDDGVSFKGGGNTVSLGAANESGTMQGHAEDTAAEKWVIKGPIFIPIFRS